MSVGPLGDDPFPNRMEGLVVLYTYYSHSTTEAFPMPGLQIPVGSFLRTVAGFPDETDSVLNRKTQTTTEKMFSMLPVTIVAPTEK